MADPFSAVPGLMVPGEIWPADPATAALPAAAVTPPPGQAQRPVILAFRN